MWRSMYSLMSMRVSACSSSKRNSARALASSVLPHAARAEEEERADGLARIAQADAAAAHGLGDGAHRLVLADDAAGEALLHLEELLGLALEHLGDRDAGPVVERRGDVALADAVRRRRDALALARPARRRRGGA